jgi:hypothetical protein
MGSPQVLAEQTTDNTGPPYSTAANLDFRVVIPTFLRFRIGNPVGITLVDFDMSGSEDLVGDGSDVARTNGGAVPVQLVFNGGTTASIQATAPAGLTNGSGGTIAYSEILSSSDNANLDAPILVNGLGVAVPVLGGGSGILNQSANWTFSYSNTNVVPGGTYGGVNVNGGRVVYTATAP